MTGAETADHRLMGLALAMGRRNLGQTWPNPSVGAVVAAPDDGRVLAAATTARGGRPHAEPLALAAAGEAARGATLYVSLEPCSHHGRTPPCTDAIVEAGVARVVTSIGDADPRVAGRGHDFLRAAGIAVTSGVRSGEAMRDHDGHLVRVASGRPAVSLKLARTRDGYAAAAGGPRLMITGAAAAARTHMLRARADAVMVGIGTVLADDPRLDVRLPGLADRSPLRIIVDTHLRMPIKSRLVHTARQRPLLVMCAEDADPWREERLAEEGATVLRIPVGQDGRLKLDEALRRLAAYGLTRILCEGGPALGEALAEADLVDELIVLTSAGTLGQSGMPALGLQLTHLVEGGFRSSGREVVGEDLIESFDRRGPCLPAS